MLQPAKTTRTVKHIFIASPGDLSEERAHFPRVLETVNKVKAHAMGIRLEPLGWEDTLPGLGRPQELINSDVAKCELFVMVLWKRWGTPPGKDSPYTSGTEEEFELARHLFRNQGVPNIFLYFRQVPEVMLADPGEQLRKVLDCRKKIEAERELLFKHYGALDEWEQFLMEHIARWLDGFQPPSSPPSAPIPPDVLERIAELEAQVRRLAEERHDAQTKLREVALDLARRATAAASDGRLTDAEELFAKANQTYPEPWVVNAAGLYYYQIGSLQRAEEKFRELEQLGTEENAREYLATSYGNLGLIYKTRGDLHAAEQMFRRSLAPNEELGRKEGMASAYGKLGLIYRTRGDLRTAEEMLRKALALEEELGRREGMADGYGNLGVIYMIRGDPSMAEEMLRKALALQEQLGLKEGMASSYGNLGLMYRMRGDLSMAEDMLHKALALEEELGRREGMATAYGNLGIIYITRGDLKTAEEMVRKALALEEQLGRREGMASAYGNLGVIYATRGDLNTAEEMHRKSLALFEEVGAQPQIEQSRQQLDEIRQQRQKPESQ